MLKDDEVILGNGTVTITLPTAILASNREYVIKNIHASLNTTIATPGSETIDGASTVVLSTQYDAVHLFSDGANFHITGNKA